MVSFRLQTPVTFTIVGVPLTIRAPVIGMALPPAKLRIGLVTPVVLVRLQLLLLPQTTARSLARSPATVPLARNSWIGMKPPTAIRTPIPAHPLPPSKRSPFTWGKCADPRHSPQEITRWAYPVGSIDEHKNRWVCFLEQGWVKSIERQRVRMKRTSPKISHALSHRGTPAPKEFT
jgi:hypothetical protein